MEEEQDQMNMNNFRGRRKKTFSSCFGNSASTQHRRRASFDGDYSPAPTNKIMRRSPSSGTLSGWFKSKPENSKPRNNFMSRIGGHRRHASADQFSYDPLSYSLNFDDDAAAASSSDDYPAMSFTARLPASPPSRTPALDHHKLPRAAVPLPRSPPEEKLTAGKEDLRRGFEALSIRMKSFSRKEADKKTSSQRRTELSSPRAAAAADVRRTLEAEEVTSPAGISTNRRGLLVQLC